MKLPFFWIDAFTDRVFSGNPAGVVPLDAWIPDALMQQIAFENGLAETAFSVRTGEDRFHLRWFTPKLEVDLCGHATLATAFTLFELLGHKSNRVIFDSRSGSLAAARLDSGLIELDFPARRALPVPPAANPPGLLAGLRVQPVELYLAKGCSNYLAIYDSVETVRMLKPDFQALASLGDVRAIATARGVDCDFVSRFFAPGAGIPEDPVTGSAHCTLVPYWAARLGKKKLHARQISARGGELLCELKDERVHMAGSCVCYLRGDIAV
jgi:predicted PhzF superfamily epimerase YddE/YHI9